MQGLITSSSKAEFLLAFTHPCSVTQYQQHRKLAFLLVFHLKCSGKLSKHWNLKRKEKKTLFFTAPHPEELPPGLTALTHSLLGPGEHSPYASIGHGTFPTLLVHVHESFHCHH